MQEEGSFRSVTYVVWRLSRRKLLSPNLLEPVGDNSDAQVSPEEPRLGPDGSVYVQTLACGLERITGLTADHPAPPQLVYTFPGDWCGVPIVGHFLVETAFYAHVAIVLDISNGAKLVEVSPARKTSAATDVILSEAKDPVTKRNVVTLPAENCRAITHELFDT